MFHLFIYQLVDIGLLLLFSCYNQVSVSITYKFCVDIYFCFSWVYTSRVELLGHLLTVLTHLRNHQIFFQDSCLILQSYLFEVPIISTFSSTLVFSHLLILASLGEAVKLYLVVVLISIYLMANEVDHLSMCLWAICKFSLEKCLFSILFPFFTLGHFSLS